MRTCNSIELKHRPIFVFASAVFLIVRSSLTALEILMWKREIRKIFPVNFHFSRSYQILLDTGPAWPPPKINGLLWNQRSFQTYYQRHINFQVDNVRLPHKTTTFWCQFNNYPTQTEILGYLPFVSASDFSYVLA